MDVVGCDDTNIITIITYNNSTNTRQFVWRIETGCAEMCDIRADDVCISNDFILYDFT